MRLRSMLIEFPGQGGEDVVVVDVVDVVVVVVDDDDDDDDDDDHDNDRVHHQVTFSHLLASCGDVPAEYRYSQ